MSLIFVGFPVPTLKNFPFVDSFSVDRTTDSAISETCVKSRIWLPSPNTVIGLPFFARAPNIATAQLWLPFLGICGEP